MPTISVPESLADCLSNDAFNYTYTDEDGNTVSKSDMVAGKTYSVKATLKPEYAANFEFIDASGAVLPDASVSTSQEFDYSGENSGGNMDASEIEKMLREQNEWYKKLLYMFLGVLGAITVIVLVIVILFGRLLKTVKENGVRINPAPKASDDGKVEDESTPEQD